MITLTNIPFINRFKKGFLNMQVTRLMRLKPVTVSFDTPLHVVWHLISDKQMHMVPVVDDENRLRGVITAEDLLKNLVPDYRNFFTEFYPDAPDIDDIEDQIEQHVYLTAKDVMNKTVYSAYEDMNVFKALSRMMVYNVRILPVIDNNDKIIGFIVEKDIFRYLFAKKSHLFEKLKKVKSAQVTISAPGKKVKKISILDLAKNLKAKPSRYLQILKIGRKK